MKVTCQKVIRLEFLGDGDLSHFILALHTPEEETKGLVHAAFFISLPASCHSVSFWIIQYIAYSFSGCSVLARQMVGDVLKTFKKIKTWIFGSE